MKKYVKPELFFERYELSQHIADCAWELTYAQNSCKATADEDKLPGFEPLFTTTTDGCVNTTDDGKYQDYCYTNGAVGINVFIS